MPKRKKIPPPGSNLKRPFDPLGKPIQCAKFYFLSDFYHDSFFIDDILRQNLLLNKYAKSAEHQSRPLGKN